MYLKNAWYCASWDKDLKDKPIGIKIMGQRLLIFRKQDGSIAALDAVCPHRYAPLHKGRLENDILQCPYHGLEFNSDGQCTLNPHGEVIPANAKLRSYPAMVQNLAVWVWMGDPEKADPSLLLEEQNWTSSNEFARGYGYTHVRGNYQLVIDNLLDLTHGPYVHVGGFGQEPREMGLKYPMNHEFFIEDRQVHSRYYRENWRTNLFFRPFFPHDYCDQDTFMCLHQPSNLTLDITVREVDAEKGLPSEFFAPSFHFITPEDETTAHYFYAAGRNRLIDDEAITAKMMEGVRVAFEDEDEVMIRDVQEAMESTDLLSLKPAILESDIAGISARKILKKMIAEE